MRTYLIKLICGLLHVLPETRAFRFKALVLRRLGFDVHPTVRVVSSFQITGKPTLTVGEDAYIGHGFRIYGDGEIIMGPQVDIGPEVSLVTGTHAIDVEGPRAAGKGRCDPIVVGTGTWIGARSIVLGGTRIGRHCVIAAGSVVRGEFQDYALIAGNPAKRLRDLREPRS